MSTPYLLQQSLKPEMFLDAASEILGLMIVEDDPIEVPQPPYQQVRIESYERTSDADPHFLGT